MSLIEVMLLSTFNFCQAQKICFFYKINVLITFSDVIISKVSFIIENKVYYARANNYK